MLQSRSVIVKILQNDLCRREINLTDGRWIIMFANIHVIINRMGFVFVIKK